MCYPLQEIIGLGNHFLKHRLLVMLIFLACCQMKNLL